MRFAEGTADTGNGGLLGGKESQILCEPPGLVWGEVHETEVFEGRVPSAFSIARSNKGGGSTAELMGAGLAVASGRGLSEIGRSRRRYYCPSCRGRFASLFALMFHRCSLQRKESLWPKA